MSDHSIKTLFESPFNTKWTAIVHIGKHMEKGYKIDLGKIPGSFKISEMKQLIFKAIIDAKLESVTHLDVDSIYMAHEFGPIEFKYELGIIVELPLPVSINSQFVTEDGSTLSVSPTLTNSNVLISDLYPEPSDIHIYTLNSLIDEAKHYQSSKAGIKNNASNERLFHGFIQVYFPGITQNVLEYTDRSPTSGGKDYKATSELKANLDLLETKLKKQPSALAKIRGFHRFEISVLDAFDISKYGSLQTFFYQLQTSAKIPFIRYVPASKGPGAIAKLYTIPGLRSNMPYVRDSKLVRSWLSERKLINRSTGTYMQYIAFKLEIPTATTPAYATCIILEKSGIGNSVAVALTCKSDNLISPESITYARNVIIDLVEQYREDELTDDNIQVSGLNFEMRWSSGSDYPIIISDAVLVDTLHKYAPFFAIPDFIERETSEYATALVMQSMKRMKEIEWTRYTKQANFIIDKLAQELPLIDESDNDEDDSHIESDAFAMAAVASVPRISLYASASEIAILVSDIQYQTQIPLLQTLISMVLSDAEKVDTTSKDSDAAGSEIPLKKYYITQLKEADESLFEYKKKDSGQNQYSRKCGAHVQRQPNVLTPEQFKKHQLEYSDDVAFWIYDPATYVPGTIPPATIDGKEVVHLIKTTTKRASTPAAQAALMNYYFCPLYWCVFDNMMLLKKDFEGTKWRVAGKRGAKPPNTCPFCGGEEVSSKGAKKDGDPMIILHGDTRETVIVRANTKGSAPQYPHIISEHPDDPTYRLPCCNARLGDIEAKLHSGNLKPFARIFKKFTEVNVLSADKNDPKPLAPGKLGMLRPALKDYFQRGMPDSNIFTTQGAHRLILPRKHTMLQVGIDNTPLARSYSFLSLLAFYHGISEPTPIHKFIDALFDFVTPRVFQSLQYGRLVHEFYKETAELPTDAVLEEWVDASDLGEISKENRPYLQRLYIAYMNFVKYTTVGVTEEPATPDEAVKFKDWRVYAQIARMPGFLHPRGVQLVLLELTQRGTQKYRVLCPPGGVSDIDPPRDAPVAICVFTPKYYTWEPVVLADAQGPQFMRLLDAGTAEFKTRYKIISEALDGMLVEYRSLGRCGPPVTSTLGAGQLTATELINAAHVKIGEPDAALRDTYNQLRGFVWNIAGDNIFIPCVDNGVVYDFKAVYEKRGFVAPAIASVLKFYKDATWLGAERAPVERVALSENQLAAEQGRSSAGEGLFWIVGIRLANGEIVPTALEKTTEPEITASQRDAMPIRAMSFSPDAIDKALFTIDNEYFSDETMQKRNMVITEEIYQHIRIAVAERLQTDVGLRARVEKLIRSTAPVVQRQRDMLIIISSIMRDIVVPVEAREALPPVGSTDNEFEVSAHFRRNCHSITSAKGCTASGQCGWVDNGAVCRVRMPDAIYGITEDPDLHLAKKLADELIRYPIKREEIMNNHVPRMPPIRSPILSEHGELLFPESWADFTEFATHYWKQPSLYKNNYKFYGDEGLVVDVDTAEDAAAVEEMYNGEHAVDVEDESEELVNLNGLF